MARYRGPVCRLCRREGTRLYLKGAKCYTNKCEIERRPTPPGMHGEARGQKKASDYALRLREKQKARRIYGVLERQFRSYFQKSAARAGITGETLLQLLERRLDNVVFRLGIGASRSQARQLVRHGHVLVNRRRVNIPSFLVSVGDVVEVKEKSRKVSTIVGNLDVSKRPSTPSWLEQLDGGMAARVIALPSRADIDTQVLEQLIVEHYSR